MEVNLKEKPKNPIIIEGFPGFGLIGTISTEFLIDQLKAEQIGTIKIKESPAMVAIHEKKIVQPMGLFYDKKNNLLILHIITPIAGVEWDIAKSLVDIAKELKAKEIISLEGVSAPAGDAEESKCFYYSNRKESKKKFDDMKVEALKEGIILGVTGALLLETEELPMSAIFTETHSAMPDSKASAKIIDVLNKYLGLGLDTKPLLEEAVKFEKKLKSIVDQSKIAKDQQERKKLNYVG
jgi:uncharacterized protein